MQTRARGVFIPATAVVLTLALGSPAFAATTPDPWTSPDKPKHFTASALIAAGAAQIFCGAGLDRREARGAGAGMAMVVGLGKELYDSDDGRSPTGFSGKDVVWDVAGILLAMALSERTGAPSKLGPNCLPDATLVMRGHDDRYAQPLTELDGRPFAAAGFGRGDGRPLAAPEPAWWRGGGFAGSRLAWRPAVEEGSAEGALVADLHQPPLP